MDDLLAEFDNIISDAPVDFLGTGSDSRWANKEESEWRGRIDEFRKKLIKIVGKSIEEAAHTLASQLSKEFPKAGSFTVGHDQNDTIFVYEHIRGMSHAAPKEYYGFKVIRKYLGKVKPC